MVLLALTGAATVAAAPQAYAAAVRPGGSTPPATANVAPAVRPSITVADSNTSHGTARGTAAPGDSLRVLDPVHPASSLCTATVATDGSWACAVALASGPNQTLTVRDLSQTSLPDVESAPFSVLTEPTISTPSGVAVGASVSGTGFPGATVTAAVTGTGASSGTSTTVTATVLSSGAWSAILPASTVPTGTYSVTATQSSNAVPDVPVSSASPPVDISVDRTAPSAPVLQHPASGSTVATQPFTMSGTGETGATVTTYIDSNPVCTALVRDGSWSCTTEGLLIPGGTRVVQAAQRDPAGNFGPASPARKIEFAAHPAATSSPSGHPRSSVPAPGQSSAPGGGASAGSGSNGGSSGAPSSSGSSGDGSAGSGWASGGSATSGGAGAAGSGPASGSVAAQAAASWTAPTGFGRDLPTLAQSVTSWAWIWALILGVVFVVFVIAPLRLAAAALGGRLAVRARRLTGRNRSASEVADTPLLPPVASIAATIIGGAVLVAVSFGVDDQLRYVRLVVAIAAGLALVNGLGAVLPAAVLGRRFGLRLRLGASPRLLLVAALACLAVRLLHVDPPLVLGVLVVAGLVDADAKTLDEAGDVRRGGILATAQLGSLALVSLGAWVAHGLLPAGSPSFAVEVTREALATAALGGLGSLVVLLVPIGRLPGRALLSWSVPTLVGLGVVGAALAVMVYTGGPGSAFALLPLVVAAVVFAVAALSAWVWIRVVEPALDDVP